jgi:hypothetical protein
MIGMALPGLAMAARPAPAADRPPEVLKRVGTWVVNYDNDACHLAAQFGEGKQMVVLRMTRYQPGEHVTLGLYGNRMATDTVRSRGTLDFGLFPKPL